MSASRFKLLKIYSCFECIDFQLARIQNFDKVDHADVIIVTLKDNPVTGFKNWI